MARKKNPPRKQKTDPKPQILTKNSYEIVNQLPEDGAVQDLHKELLQTKSKNQYSAPPDPNREPHLDEKGNVDGDILMQLDDKDLVGIDLENPEEALNQKDLHALLEEQLQKVHKVFLDYSTRSTARLAIATESLTSSKKVSRENKRRGRKPLHQLIKEAGSLMINLGNIHKISEGYFHLTPPLNDEYHHLEH
jgi:hypothetical protein